MVSKSSRPPSNVNSNMNSGSSPDVLQTLAWVRKQGFRPVPLQPGTKAAAVRDYTTADYKPPADEHWHSRDLGIGVALGPQLNGPVDIDLDCDETIRLAPYFLPQTKAIFGRPGKPRSHFVYKVTDDECPKNAYHDPITRKCLVELRADGGHQTVFPGSIHEGTGELISWSEVPFPDIVEISAEALELSVRRLAVAALISRYLWEPGTRNENNKHLFGMFFYMGWTLEETENMISAVMAWHGDEDKTQHKTLRVTYKRAEAGKKVTGARSLKKVVPEINHPVIDKILEWTGAAENSILMDYNERFAVVRIGGTFRVADLDVEPGNPPVLMNKDNFLDFYSAERVVINDKRVPKAKLWLANEQRRMYKDVDFIPGATDDIGLLNMWTGWATKPVDDRAKCASWLRLLREVICGGDKALYEWMLHWFANILVEPTHKSLTAPVIIGKPGAGKSILVDYFGKILGSNYLTVTDAEHVQGRFNSHLSTTLLLHSAEALYGGDKKHRGIIKSLITDNTRILEPKGIDAKSVKNYLRLILTSNEMKAAPVEVNDRRFTVIDLKDRKASKGLIRKILDEMKDDGPAALQGYLLALKYDPDRARSNFKNKDHANLVNRNLDALESWWMETLHSGYLLPPLLIWAQRPDLAPWPSKVSTPALKVAADWYLRQYGTRYAPNAMEFNDKLKKFLGVDVRKKTVMYKNPGDSPNPDVAKLNDRMMSIVDLPDLDACRKQFEKYLGMKIDWEDVTIEDPLPHERDRAKTF